MLIYNVTIKVENDVHDEWLHWMQNNHILDVINTGLFTGHRMLKVLVDDDDGVTYSIQYLCKSQGHLDTYFKEHAEKLQKEHTDKYEGKFVAFRTMLEEV
jgi:hypothetical protein